MQCPVCVCLCVSVVIRSLFCLNKTNEKNLSAPNVALASAVSSVVSSMCHTISMFRRAGVYRVTQTIPSRPVENERQKFKTSPLTRMFAAKRLMLILWSQCWKLYPSWGVLLRTDPSVSYFPLHGSQQKIKIEAEKSQRTAFDFFWSRNHHGRPIENALVHG
jgi:hypothetical protein